MTIATRAITILRRLLDGLLLALVVVSLGVVVLGRLVPLTGHQTLVVAGPSMGSAIPMGSVVVLDQVPASALAVGDVVTLRSGAERAIFTHRIIRIADRDGTPWVETQGDANGSPDPSLTSSEAVLGRVGLSVPYAGYLLTLYSAPSGILLVMSVGLILLILGISLEPQASRRPATPGPAAGTSEPERGGRLVLASAMDPQRPVADRPDAKAAVRASREGRTRRASVASATSRRRTQG